MPTFTVEKIMSCAKSKQMGTYIKIIMKQNQFSKKILCVDYYFFKKIFYFIFYCKQSFFLSSMLSVFSSQFCRTCLSPVYGNSNVFCFFFNAEFQFYFLTSFESYRRLEDFLWELHKQQQQQQKIVIISKREIKMQRTKLFSW